MSPHRFSNDHRVLHTPAIWHPSGGVKRDGYWVVLFRRRFVVRGPKRVALWITASQRFELYLDGRLIARGPSRSDPIRWAVRRVVLGRLGPGTHVLAVRVTHFGRFAGVGQMGGRGFLLVRAVGMDDLTTGPQWKCFHDESRRPVTRHAWGKRGFYYAVGCGDRVDGRRVPWGWETPGFDDGKWPAAKVVCKRAADPWGNVPLDHVLRPDPLPPMEEKSQRLVRVVEAPADLRGGARRWIAGRGPLHIGPGRRVRLVLDRGEMTNAYPVLSVSGGAGSRIRLVSAEGPYDPQTKAKTHRDHTAGRALWGQRDDFLPDGGKLRAFTTLWFRSFRYLELVIRTASRAITLNDIHLLFTGFPLRRRARFGGRPADHPLWNVSWRTARLCAHETFFDCPHFEQAQFPGDTRVQAIYHYVVCGEDRLARKAIDDFHASLMPDGITQCRWPSRQLQILPTYSLYWIGMLEDFRVHRGDRQFLKPYLPGARAVLEWFARRRRRDGMLGWIEFAPFMDWTPAFECGNAPQGPDGGSSILTLLLAQACDWMSELERSCGYAQLSDRWRRMGRDLVRATLGACWDRRRGLLADTATKRSFSQHAQVQAILARAWPARRAGAILARAMGDPSVTPPGTLYFRYYVIQALAACGMHDRIDAMLDPWRRCLRDTGLTTWPESDGPSPRSDCHAWSVTPGILLASRHHWSKRHLG
jgi:hypothetical protein